MQLPTEPDEAYEKRWQPPESVDCAEFKPVAEKIPEFVRTDDGIDLTTVSARALSDHLMTKLLAVTARG